jgi:DNA topoisomerase-1
MSIRSNSIGGASRHALWSGPGYTLVICEKPDAALRVAAALSSSSVETLKVEGVTAFRVVDAKGRSYVVCAASGHLYGISDTVRGRRVFPVADLEWFPLGAVRGKNSFAASRIRAIGKLSQGATAFVNACDLDVEGETIGYNVLRYACGGKEGVALRAKFSSLTEEEIQHAFGNALAGYANGARAGRMRHVIDFLWGVNLSRALSESLRTSHRFTTISIGRVQGPTLGFAVEREVEIRTFVPTPYWSIKGSFRRGKLTFDAAYLTVLQTERAAREVKNECLGKEGVVAVLERRKVGIRPPPPFNLADLQKEAFRLFGYSPSKTLQVAERLYLAALISYPRTSSQKLPRLDYAKLFSRIAALQGYSEPAGEVIARGVFHPSQGAGVDLAHPAIHPTGESPRRALAMEERRIFDLVVRRFISCFGEAAVQEVSSAEIAVGSHRFGIEEKRLLVPGWMKLARDSRAADDNRVTLALQVGDGVSVESIAIEEHMRARLPRYNQASLLEKMEKEGIGTKATRADVISTLLKRGYVSGDGLVPSELGLALIELMRQHCPQIISTRMTREMEAQLERIERVGYIGSEFFEETLSSLLTQLYQLKSHREEIAQRVGRSIPGQGASAMTVLGACPLCKDGKLWVVRSKKSGKRFVGCTNYSKGCTASAPLPQRGTVRASPKPCTSCGWPVVYVRLGRRPWRLCVNDKCPKKVNVYAMQDLHKRRNKQ